jgi:dihydrofolate reductase
MRKLLSFVHISLDGYVAGPEGQMDWITVNDEIFDFVGEHCQKGDTACYGRITYEMMEAYWPGAGGLPNATKHQREHSKWYKSIYKVVLSTTLAEDNLENTVVLGSNYIAKMQEIKASKGEDILVFGSPSATHSLMEAGLIDGFWLFLNPVSLGKGIPLFNEGEERMNLQLLRSTTFHSGVVELLYITGKK